MSVLKSSSFKKVLQYAKPFKSKLFSVAFWAIFLAIVAALRPLVLNITIDKYFVNSGKETNVIQDYFLNLMSFILEDGNNAYNIKILVALMLIILILEVVAQYFFVYVSSWLGQDIVKVIREKLFSHLASFKMRYFDNEPVGKLITRCVSDMENIASIFSQGLFMIVSDFLKMIIVLAFMLIINWKITCIVLLILPLILIATNIFNKKMKVAFNEVRNEVANLNTFIQERLTGMKIVQLFNREKIELEKFKEINEKHNKAWLKNILYNSIFFPIADIISSITLGLVVYFGALFIINGDTQTSVGQLISFNMYISMLYNPLRQIADKFNVMQMGIVAADRVFEILETHEEVQDNGTIHSEKLQGNIKIENVKFSYIKGEEILKGLNLEVKQGETIAIVGATGAGKSTIINLLNRFYEIDSGRILIDDININDYSLETLRKEIAMVLQDVFLFADSIYNNITLFDENIKKEEVYEAAKKIGIHDFLMSLPNGYDYDVKERGVMLSSGQRQLIAFLRAFISNPSILILDEATSSIDSYSEELIQNATKKLTEGRTSIIIAHRLATIVNADKIIVMDKGLIVEQGNHNELLKLENGFYKKLYEAQFEKPEVLS
ncbi:ABC transporter ATP-binding protein [Flavobacterium urocaniciphilum]|uniref:ABC-type multidrug transport system, ATPase and permease component n=1 Tax=Flavobacterium urocaniciphilum TaxID=1299341 RepID=A0A1H8Z6M2_9FLAO|nr:ABC transporter ATP-binding protein [Flavobacterium urocaniciphilum]SEP60080.1 ABC-type multidrug transport system, ATPase and permease component [Flavobacterium urocaniciphilum]